MPSFLSTLQNQRRVKPIAEWENPDAWYNTQGQVEAASDLHKYYQDQEEDNAKKQSTTSTYDMLFPEKQGKIQESKDEQGNVTYTNSPVTQQAVDLTKLSITGKVKLLAQSGVNIKDILSFVQKEQERSDKADDYKQNPTYRAQEVKAIWALNELGIPLEGVWDDSKDWKENWNNIIKSVGTDVAKQAVELFNQGEKKPEMNETQARKRLSDIAKDKSETKLRRGDTSAFDEEKSYVERFIEKPEQVETDPGQPRQIVRTGLNSKNGNKVVKYSDGTTEEFTPDGQLVKRYGR